MSDYVFDQAWREERARLAGIEALWDPGSQRLVRELGIGAGARILEIGAGGGALVEWMANLVGEQGRVMATDLDPRFLEAIERPNVEVVQHDVVADPLPDEDFDLIHTRLVLEHLPARLEILDKLAGALGPVTVLLIEDYDWGSHDLFPATELMRRVIDGAGSLMEEQGYDRFFGRRLVGELGRRLRHVRSDGRLALIQTTSPGAAAFRLSLVHLGPRLVERGDLTQDELDAAQAEFGKPDRLIISPAMVAAWGTRA